jgi:hypothetical protein
LIKMLILALLTPLILGCQTYQVHPFEVGITLPYSQKCRFKNVVTKDVRELDPAACEDMKMRSLILTSEAWHTIRNDIQSNCALQQCAELTGKLDQIFLDIDQGLDKIPQF